MKMPWESCSNSRSTTMMSPTLTPDRCLSSARYTTTVRLQPQPTWAVACGTALPVGKAVTPSNLFRH